MRKKLSIVGAGNVGAAAAHWAASQQLADVVLVDIAPLEGKTKGKALDLLEATPVLGLDVNMHGTSDFADSANSDVVVITAGIARKPGMSRDDLIGTNARIVKEVTEKVVAHSPGCILVYVTNPLDAMVYLGYGGTPKNDVLGEPGNIDGDHGEDECGLGSEIPRGRGVDRIICCGSETQIGGNSIRIKTQRRTCQCTGPVR